MNNLEIQTPFPLNVKESSAETQTRVLLTEKEYEVAALAAQRMSRKDIAASLFLTTKTVDTYLGIIYRKLKIRGKHELPLLFSTDLSVHKVPLKTWEQKLDQICVEPMTVKELMDRAGCAVTTAYRYLKSKGMFLYSNAVNTPTFKMF